MANDTPKAAADAAREEAKTAELSRLRVAAKQFMADTDLGGLVNSTSIDAWFAAFAYREIDAASKRAVQEFVHRVKLYRGRNPKVGYLTIVEVVAKELSLGLPERTKEMGAE